MAKGKARIRGKRVGGLDRVSLMAWISRVNQSRPCVVLISSTADLANCVAMRSSVKAKGPGARLDHRRVRSSKRSRPYECDLASANDEVQRSPATTPTRTAEEEGGRRSS